MPKLTKAQQQVLKDEAEATKREEARQKAKKKAKAPAEPGARYEWQIDALPKAPAEPGYQVHLGGGQYKFVPTGKPKE